MADRVASSPLGQFFSPVKKSTLEFLQNEVASLTEERDFFKSKYSAQMDDIAGLEKDLKAARNQIAKLREELIAAEMERAKGAGIGMAGGNVSIRSETCPSTTGVLSSGNDSISREGEEIPEDEDIVGEGERPPPQDEPLEGRVDNGGDSDVDEEKNKSDEDKSDDEVDDIRDHAAKMLIWANYQEVRAAQSTRRISSSTDISVASPSSSVRTPSEQVPRTIQTSSPVAAAASARASARSLLGLTDGDDDVDDERTEERSCSDGEGESEYGSESDDEEDVDAVKTPSKSTLDGVRKLLSPQF